jgi:hypothetical protein
MQSLDDFPNGFGFQIRAPNLPRSARSGLFTLQHAGIDQTFDRTVTHAA